MTKKLTRPYSRFDIVAVPFPFTDRDQVKRRPALVISNAKSFNGRIGHCVMAMITSSKNAPWPLDIEINDLQRAGLPAKSVIRMKLFTLDQRVVLRRLGHLSNEDSANALLSLRKLLGL
jgi:mRNA interferase MazF